MKMCARASQPLNIFAYVVSSTSAFSLRLMPFRLAVGSTPALTGSSAPPLPSLTVAQRVHPHHLPSSLHYTSNMTPPLYIGHDDLNQRQTQQKGRTENQFPCSLLTQDLVTPSRSARAFFTHTCQSGHVPGPCSCPCPPSLLRVPPPLCKIGP
jgi:hypothetical protein